MNETALEKAKRRLRAAMMDALDNAMHSAPGPWTDHGATAALVLRVDDIVDIARAEGRAEERARCVLILEQIRDSTVEPISPGPEDLAIGRIMEADDE